MGSNNQTSNNQELNRNLSNSGLRQDPKSLQSSQLGNQMQEMKSLGREKESQISNKNPNSSPFSSQMNLTQGAQEF